ncbi:DUF7594 domain-containing protein [Rhizohabitans arisaemae]|uniref:CBM96 family carbohydrate-binding protein n=1 Tax=Rhizohabitans arisaemae TaxID=2720610 RepID=UPI0024B2767D|nr:DNRLRE domain-containing protein [Rhizohabitans arisaemae]
MTGAIRARRTHLIAGTAVIALAGVVVLPVADGEARAQQAEAVVKAEVTQDTYVSSYDPAKGKGADQVIKSGPSPENRLGLVKFNVSGWPKGDGCEVAAKLRLWPGRLLKSKAPAQTLAGTTSVHKVGGTWTESTTWNPAASRPKLGQEIGTATGLAAGTPVTFDVAAVVQGDGEVSFAIVHQGTAEEIEFASGEAAQADRRPQLKITYQTSPTCGGGDDGGGGGDAVMWGLYRSGNADIGKYEGTAIKNTGDREQWTVSRKFDAFRRYYSFSQVTGTSPKQTLNWLKPRDIELARERTLFMAMENACYGECPTTFNGVRLPAPVSFTGSNVPTDFQGKWWHPKDVASGGLDPLLKAAAQKVKSFPGRVMLDISGEIDSQTEWMGDTAQRREWLAGYKAMWQHIHRLFAREGVTNVTWNLVVGGFARDNKIYTESYPGDAYVDWISWDPYDNSCRKGSAFGTFNTFYAKLENGLLPGGSNNKYGIMEYGFGAACQETYLKNMAADLKRLPKIRAVLYFDRGNMPYTLSAAGWKAFGQSGTDAYFKAASR